MLLAALIAYPVCLSTVLLATTFIGVLLVQTATSVSVCPISSLIDSFVLRSSGTDGWAHDDGHVSYTTQSALPLVSRFLGRQAPPKFHALSPEIPKLPLNCSGLESYVGWTSGGVSTDTFIAPVKSTPNLSVTHFPISPHPKNVERMMLLTVSLGCRFPSPSPRTTARVRYGSQRLWGAVGFGVASLLGGYVSDVSSGSFSGAILLFLGFMVITFATSTTLFSGRAEGSSNSRSR